jgi:hypothetical protein
MLMHTKPHLSTQGELFSPPAKLRQLPPEARQKMVRLLARMLNEHLQKDSRASARAEVGDE